MVGWDTDINFASALLLHSCLTVIIKEALNVISIACRLVLARNDEHGIARSVVLDGYTSVLSCDCDGDLAELYFTNTGLFLLGVSLASAVAMNLFLSDLSLNILVSCTFGFCWVASIFSCRKSWLMVILALRRAGRFIWSDTPFVNFFTLIYVAVVLHGDSTIRLKDYITLRSIAIIELVFMKAYIAASNMEKQIELLKSLCKSRLVLYGGQSPKNQRRGISPVERNSIVPFTSTQRMAVMFFKTTVGHDYGSVRGSMGPGSIPVPRIDNFVDDNTGSGEWRIYRLQEDVMLIADTLRMTDSKGVWKRFISRAHGVFLRRLGKIRVVYLLRDRENEVKSNPVEDETSRWVSNVNFVTGVSKSTLENFRPAERELLERGIVV
ncbi:uncharacterized protein CTRU02_203788 [Colletotrichum truncatum]|uniref:Uncharacterized protein n=1 Tax=Colletotrichum truncatum TaxID=5467 RepID=A0ACC3ZAL3_COLTU